MIPSQKYLPRGCTPQTRTDEAYHDRLVSLLLEDLDFHNMDSRYASHNFHSFPAKFPPQLPQNFITNLTRPNDVVLDPMMGSGTTVLEAFLSDRKGIGFDIDPLAISISRVKVNSLDTKQVAEMGNRILKQATLSINQRHDELKTALETSWDDKTKEFIDKWFTPETQIELLALITEIEKVTNETIKEFFKLAFSSTIITKSGGVSLALDLAHTRPHLAKVVITQSGEVILGNDLVNTSSRRIKILTKTLRPALKEFERRFNQNLKGNTDVR